MNYFKRLNTFALLLTLAAGILGFEMAKDWSISRQVGTHYAFPYHDKEAVMIFQGCVAENMQSRVNAWQFFVARNNPTQMNARWFAAENSCKIALHRHDLVRKTQSERYFSLWRKSKPVEYPNLLDGHQESIAALEKPAEAEKIRKPVVKVSDKTRLAKKTQSER